MNIASPRANRDSLITLRHAGDLVLVICQDANIRIRPPNVYFAVFVPRQEQMSVTIYFHTQALEKSISVVSNHRHTTDR